MKGFGLFSWKNNILIFRVAKFDIFCNILYQIGTLNEK